MRTPILLALALSSFALTRCMAQISSITFHGTITSITSGGTVPGVSIGDPFVFKVQYDFSPNVASPSYEPGSTAPAQAGYIWFGKGYSLSASFGEYAITTTDNHNVIDVRERSNPAIQRGFAVYDGYPFTSGNYTADQTGLTAALLSTSSSGPTFPSASLASVVEYPVSDFDVNYFWAQGSFNGIDGRVVGTITSYEVVPEPVTALYAAGAMVAFAFYRRNKTRQD